MREEIADEETDRYEYVLRVDRSATGEVRTLFREGAQVQRAELELADGLLVGRRVYRGEELAVTEHYRYWSDGSLRSVRSVSERGAEVEYRYRDGRLEEEWAMRGEVVEHTSYDRAGCIVSRVRRESGEVTEREQREYWGEGADDPLRRVVVIADGEETVRRYDEEGRLLGSSTARDGEVATDRTRIFEDGVLVEEREQTEGALRVWRYEYEDERLVRERYLENGELVRITSYPAEGSYTRVETLYRSGEPALRVSYEDQPRVLEEVIRGGEVIRTRTIQAGAPDQTREEAP